MDGKLFSIRLSTWVPLSHERERGGPGRERGEKERERERNMCVCVCEREREREKQETLLDADYSGGYSIFVISVITFTEKNHNLITLR